MLAKTSSNHQIMPKLGAWYMVKPSVEERKVMLCAELARMGGDLWFIGIV